MDRYVKQVLAMGEDGAGVEYIARVVSEPVERVQAVIDGNLDRLDPTAPPRSNPERLVPVTRPFPELTDSMTDGNRIIVLTKHGLSAVKIRRYLKSTYTNDQITRYVRRKLGPRRAGNTSMQIDWIPVSFMPYIHYCLEHIGKDRYRCELCLDQVPKGCVVHHTKYEGATIYDLMYLCQSCNLARENTGLV